MEAKRIEGKTWIVFYKDHCRFRAESSTSPPTTPVINVVIGYVDYEDHEVIRMIFEGDDQGEMVGLIVLKSTIKTMVEISPTPDGIKTMKALKKDLFEKMKMS